METLSLRSLDRETKVALLRELGYDSDGVWVLKDGARYADPYVAEPVPLANMLIFPGSAIVLDNNPVSIASYFEEFGEF